MERENKRFLIALLRFHGDMVLITPLISTIKRLYPHATIDILVYKGTAKVLLDDDRINKTYEAHLSSETSFLKKIYKEIRLCLDLKKEKYDYAIFLTTQWRMALFSRLLSDAKRAGVGDPKRRGAFWKNSFDVIFPEVGDNHILERNLSSLTSLGFELIQEDYQLDLIVSDSTRISIKNKISQNLNLSQPYCVFHPFSRRETKLWNVEGFANLADYYSKRGLNVIFTSGPEKEEIDYLEKIENNCNEPVLNLGGKTQLLELAALIDDAEFFLGLDSVSSHISAAMNTPSVTLFGPSVSRNWKPWSERSIIIERTGKEEKCSKHYPLGGKFERCLCYIHPTKVIESIDKALKL